MNINEKIGQRIYNSRKKKNITATELSKSIGMSKQLISNWEKGRRVPTLDSILALSNALDTSVSYLLCTEENPEKPSAKEISLYNIENLISEQNEEIIKIPITLMKNNTNAVAIRISDESMTSLFRKNDIIIIDRDIQPYDNCYALIKINPTNQVLLRRYVIDNSNIHNPVITLKPLNKEYEDINYNSSQVSVIGVCADNLRLIC